MVVIYTEMMKSLTLRGESTNRTFGILLRKYLVILNSGYPVFILQRPGPEFVGISPILVYIIGAEAFVLLNAPLPIVLTFSLPLRILEFLVTRPTART